MKKAMVDILVKQCPKCERICRFGNMVGKNPETIPLFKQIEEKKAEVLFQLCAECAE